MPDIRELFGALLRRVSGRNAVYVRETNFGYVIRSERGADADPLRAKIGSATLAGFGFCAAAVWVLPTGIASVGATLFLSALLLAAGVVSMALIRGATSGIELHVDLGRRELRSAVVTARGESWIRSSARFGEISEVYLRRADSRSAVRSLCLRVAGEGEVMPVAIGDEKTLLAIHDRLARDFRPLEERLNARFLAGPGGRLPGRHVFPQLGPDEQRA